MATSLTAQNAVYVGINLQGILYGVELVLYFETVHAVLILKKRQRSDISLLLFSSAMLILITIWVSAIGLFGREIWLIHDAKGPEDATAYSLSAPRLRYLNLARASVLVLQLMTDGLLIHRCRVMWDSTTIIILPLILWVASLVLAVLQYWMNNFHSGRALIGLTLSYYTICVVLNTSLTSLICYRLIRHGKRTRAELGREFSSMYFAVAGITVESALPFTLSGIVSLVILGLNLDIMTPFGWVYLMMMCVSPQMLILRVLRNRSAPRRTGVSTRSASDIRFHQWSELSVRGVEGGEPKRTSPLLPLAKVHLATSGDSQSAFAGKRDTSS